MSSQMIFNLVDKSIRFVVPNARTDDLNIFHDRLTHRSKVGALTLGIVAVGYPLLAHTAVKKFCASTKDWLLQQTITWKASRTPTKEEREGGKPPAAVRLADSILEHHRSTQAEFGEAATQIVMKEYPSALIATGEGIVRGMAMEATIFMTIGILDEIMRSSKSRDSLPQWVVNLLRVPVGFHTLYQFLQCFVLVAPFEMERVPIFGGLYHLAHRFSKWTEGLTLLTQPQFTSVSSTLSATHTALWMLMYRLRHAHKAAASASQVSGTVVVARFLNLVFAVALVFGASTLATRPDSFLNRLTTAVERNFFAGRGVAYTAMLLTVPLQYFVDKSFKSTA